MKIRFLGTGAADWHGVDERGELRRRTSTLFDDSLLIDLTEETLSVIPAQARVDDVFITHSHEDHFSPGAIAALHPRRLYLHESWADEIHVPGVQTIPLTVGQWTDAAGFSLLPMPSNHSTSRPREQTLHFLLRRDNRFFLYATDGAWLLNRELKLMEGVRLSGMAIDATIGDGHEGDYRIFEHNSLPMVRIMVDTLRATGMLLPDAPVFLTHLARTLHPGKAALDRSILPPLVACHDGMTAEI